MSKKPTDLQVFVKMNENDTLNGTETLGMCYQMIGAKKARGGAAIEMGMPESELYKIMNGERIPVLILIDRKSFFEIKEGNTIANSEQNDERSVATEAK